MNVIYASNENYAWLMGVSMLSLFENNKECEELNVYLLGDCISENSNKKLNSIAKSYNRQFTLIDVEKLEIPQNITSNRYPKSAFSRVYAYKLLPKDLERVIYLDCDIIVNGNIEELYKYPMKDKALWAVIDCVSIGYKWKIGVPSNGIYINTGVLLMNLKRFREYPLADKMKDFVDKYAKAMNYADQEILNAVFQNEIGILSPVYNLMSQVNQYTYKELKMIRHPHHYYTKKELEYAKQNAIILHYTTCLMDIRPWFAGSKLKNASVFDKYLKLSPWAEQTKKEMDFSNLKFKTIKTLLIFPKPLSYILIGWLHAYLRPFYIILKLKIS